MHWPTASIQNTDMQYAIHNATHGFNTEYAIRRIPNGVQQGLSTENGYAIRNIHNAAHSLNTEHR